jgi:8-oxo-dGTP pyrophosphatase MutT (NUDIX family)
MPARPVFDPERFILIPSPASLPPVPPARLSADSLRERFRDAQNVSWVADRADEVRFYGSTPRAAAVLIGLMDRPGGLTVLLTHRAAHLTDHAGQISFPGGRCDPEDADAVDTALREAWEEVALVRERIEPLGVLPDYLTATAYAVSPVVALVHAPFDIQASVREVAEVFEVPLAFLMDPAHHQIRQMGEGAGSRRVFAMPYPRQSGEGVHFIWGATAGMLRNLYRFLIA